MITTKHAIYRVNQFSIEVAALAIIIIAFAEVAFWKALQLAPSFFQPWFLGHVALAFFGIIASQVLGDTDITVRNYIGMVFAMIAGYLLVT